VCVFLFSEATTQEAFIDFSLPASVIANKIRAFNPFPGAQTTFNKTTLKIWKAEEFVTTTSFSPGEIIEINPEKGILVACGKNTLRITELQRPGGKRLVASEFIKGFSLENGQFS